jgi:hypothetical protein
MAALAEEAGRPVEARAWCGLAAQQEPGSQEVAAILARLDRREAVLRNRQTEIDEGSSQKAPPQAHVHEWPMSAIDVQFRDDAEAAGLRFAFINGETPLRQLPETMSGGVGLLDYDGDGWLDVYGTQGGPFPPPDSHAAGDRLFRNQGDGTFCDVTERAGISRFARGYGHGVAVGDYDGDGHPDLFITRWRAYALYRNQGDGTFRDVTQSAGLDGDRDWPTSAAFADFDGDGDLDLYVCHYAKWDTTRPEICRDLETDVYIYCTPRKFPALADHVFRNDGGRFVDITAEARIVDSDGRGLGVVTADFDGDGKLDIFVANDQTANYLFRNLGGFRFEEVGERTGVASNAEGGYHAGMGVACGDFDGDGRPDIAVTNFYGESTTLYRNLGGGLFGDETAAAGIAFPTRYLLGFGAAFLDANNDGVLDLITANGHLHPLPNAPYKMPAQLFLGWRGRFREATAARGSALSQPRLGRALAVGDLDNDGRVDAVLIDHKGPLAYLHNRTADAGHFVVLRLEGSGSNRDAVGAQVVVRAGGRSQFAWRTGGGSYQSASDSRLHFGLGAATGIERIHVTWPSGRVQEFHDLAADHGYCLREGENQQSALRGFAR